MHGLAQVRVFHLLQVLHSRPALYSRGPVHSDTKCSHGNTVTPLCCRWKQRLLSAPCPLQSPSGLYNKLVVLLHVFVRDVNEISCYHGPVISCSDYFYFRLPFRQQPFNPLINRQTSPDTTLLYQSSSGVIRHHGASSGTTGRHRSSSTAALTPRPRSRPPRHRHGRGPAQTCPAACVTSRFTNPLTVNVRSLLPSPPSPLPPP